ncbi:ANTAR domain-containing protein [Streptomyces chartreusis]
MRRGHAAPAQTPPEQDPGWSTGDEEDGPALRETAELLQEREQIRHALETRPPIDLALGVLMATFTCQPDDASKILVDVSQHSNVKLQQVARAITQGASGQPIPAELQETLAAAVKAWRASSV